MFDTYLFVDWSACNRVRNRPCKDGIWVGIKREDLWDSHYFPTRNSCITWILQFLIEEVRRERGVLIGFDFAYGYPIGFHAALGLNGLTPWQSVWEFLSHEITDNDCNESNRWEVASRVNAVIDRDGMGPFWGCPKGYANRHLSATSPGFPYVSSQGVVLNRLRVTETTLRGVQPAWKICYNGSVGSQTLVGIPKLQQLRHHEQLCQHSAVWPFETGFISTLSDRRPLIIHAEIWPGIIEVHAKALQQKHGYIRDRAQVLALARWAYEHGQTGTLLPLFAPPVGITADDCERAISHEGWILGAQSDILQALHRGDTLGTR